MPLIVGSGSPKVNITQLNTISIAASAFNHNQVNISSLTGTTIVSSNANRRSLMIFNNSGVLMYIGSSITVTTSNGFMLPSGLGIEFSMIQEGYTGPVAAITAATQTSVSYIEI